MRLIPTPLDIADDEGFLPERDIFGYAEFGQRLANVVKNTDQPLVIALDGPWGSGKSTFVRQWEGLLRQDGASVIHFDAFENDHHADAFLAVAAAIIQFAKERHGGTDAAPVANLMDAAKAVGRRVIPAVARTALSAATAGVFNADAVAGVSDTAKAALEALADEGSDLVDALLRERLASAASDATAFSNFQDQLSQIAAGSMNNEDGYPLVIVIDELDRCRPDFAISLLERIKHLFCVRNTCFLVSTHMLHIETILLGKYGPGFDARTYLEKFIHLRILLPKEGRNDEDRLKKYAVWLSKELNIENNQTQIFSLIQIAIFDHAERRKISFRTLERIFSDVTLALAANHSKPIFISPIIALLCLIKNFDPVLFDNARDGKIEWGQFISFMNIDSLDISQYDFAYEWWAFCTNGPLDEERRIILTKTANQNGFEHPSEIIILSAQIITDLNFYS